MYYQSAKNYLEWLHIKYLLKNFNLSLKNRRNGPDLFSDRQIFELKTKAYRFGAGGKPRDNVGFFLPERQYLKYKNHSENICWILLAYAPSKPLHDLNKLTEKYILHRDMFFVQWDVNKTAHLGDAIKDSKLGPGRNISVKDLKSKLTFGVHTLPKANVFFTKGEDLEYLLKN